MFRTSTSSMGTSRRGQFGQMGQPQQQQPMSGSRLTSSTRRTPMGMGGQRGGYVSTSEEEGHMQGAQQRGMSARRFGRRGVSGGATRGAPRGGAAGGSAFQKPVCSDQERQEILQDLLQDHERSQFQIDLVHQVIQDRRENRNLLEVAAALFQQELQPQDIEQIYELLAEDWLADFATDGIIRKVLTDQKYNRKLIDIMDSLTCGEEHCVDPNVDMLFDEIDNKLETIVTDLLSQQPNLGRQMLNNYCSALEQLGVQQGPDTLRQLEHLIRQDFEDLFPKGPVTGQRTAPRGGMMGRRGMGGGATMRSRRGASTMRRGAGGVGGGMRGQRSGYASA